MALRVGIVGYGFAGKVFHAPLLKPAGVELAAISSSDPTKVHADFPDLKVHANIQELCADTNIDLVVLASPASFHAEQALEVLAAGKHVVVDKPFAASVDEVDAIIAAAKKAGRIVTCFQNRRWDSDFLTLRQLIESGELGEINSYRAHFEFSRPNVGSVWQETATPAVGIHYDLGHHLIDQMLVLFGLPDWIEGDILTQRENSQIKDVFHARMAKGNTRIDLFAAYYVPDSTTRYAIHGTKASYMKSFMDCQEDQLIAGLTAADDTYGKEPQERWATVTTHDDDNPATRQVPSIPGSYHQFYIELQKAITNGTPVPVPVEETRNTLRVIEAMMESSQKGTRVYF
ncbi:MAG: Gfo/Idh/MocA family oxidoreductase [Rhizobiaceae bacterium]|nr:Gfo/Idh/MocA family oxidoreductase [Rhizobiaceae bacterium]